MNKFKKNIIESLILMIIVSSVLYAITMLFLVIK